jgi:hypothetical protein
VRPTAELRALGAFYGVPVSALAARHGDALERYAEWVLERDGFSVVTLAPPADLIPAAGSRARRRLERAAAAWPSAITGIKVDAAGRREPTAYVRTVCPWDEGIVWLAREIGPEAYEIPPARTLYGLGFQAEVVKTYALSPEGFVSWRVGTGSPAREHKDYRAEVPWTDMVWPDARWQAVGEVGQRLGFRMAGHVGRHASTGELKVYVERRGGIPTDRSLA